MCKYSCFSCVLPWPYHNITTPVAALLYDHFQGPVCKKSMSMFVYLHTNLCTCRDYELRTCMYVHIHTEIIHYNLLSVLVNEIEREYVNEQLHTFEYAYIWVDTDDYPLRTCIARLCANILGSCTVWNSRILFTSPSSRCKQGPTKISAWIWPKYYRTSCTLEAKFSSLFA